MKSALIMGASGAIGAACAEELAAKGYSLYLHYFTNLKKVQSLGESLQKKFPQQDFFVVSLDMHDAQAIPAFCQQLFGVDAVVFAQGSSWYGFVSEMPAARLTELFAEHIMTPIALLQALENKLAQSKSGRVIFIGSIYGQVGSSMESVYASVKGAQLGFVKSYAREVATLGITVNLVAPGAVNTPMLAQFTTEEMNDLNNELPLLRPAQPAEIAYFVGVCADERATYLTGSVINVDGAWHA